MKINRQSIRYSTVINLCLLILMHCVCIKRIQSSIHVIEQTDMNQQTNVQFCELEGRVFDDQKQYLPGAAIKIESDTEQSFEVYSDASGKFSFSNLAPGTYSILVRLEGFKEVKLQGLVLIQQSKTLVEVTLGLDSNATFTVT